MKRLLSIGALLALVLVVSGCKPSASQNAQVPPPCPEPYSTQQVIAGVHGVDGYGRPVNACGYAVNIYGEAVETTPAVEVYAAQPRMEYRQALTQYYPTYVPVWGPAFYVGLYAGPHVVVHRDYVTTMTYRQPTKDISTHVVSPGASRQVTPGQKALPPAAAPAPGTVGGGAVTNPAKGAAPAATSGTVGGGTVTNGPKAATPAAAQPTPAATPAPQSKFNRPDAAAPAAAQPTVTAPAPQSKFNRPDAAAPAAAPANPAPSGLNLSKPSTTSSGSGLNLSKPAAPAPAPASKFIRPSKH